MCTSSVNIKVYPTILRIGKTKQVLIIRNCHHSTCNANAAASCTLHSVMTAFLTLLFPQSQPITQN